MWDSLQAVFDHVRRHDPDAAQAALDAYLCFEPYQMPEVSPLLVPGDCEDEVVRLLTQTRQRAVVDGSAEFSAWQNAEIVAAAERYYRATLRGGPGSWNIRDTHMADTLGRLLEHYGPDAKAVVWAHNTHVGDARATDMAEHGMLNIGQLARQRYGDQVVLVGFGGYQGTVIAADYWGAPARIMTVPPARQDSIEAALREEVLDRALFVFAPVAGPRLFTKELGHRAIGVVYDPAREHAGNYVPTRLAQRYDAFCWFIDTAAVHPLPTVGVETEELETFPTGV